MHLKIAYKRNTDAVKPPFRSYDALLTLCQRADLRSWLDDVGLYLYFILQLSLIMSPSSASKSSELYCTGLSIFKESEEMT